MFVVTLADQGIRTTVAETAAIVANTALKDLQSIDSEVGEEYNVFVYEQTNSAKLQADTMYGKLVIVFIGNDAKKQVVEAYNLLLKEQEK